MIACPGLGYSWSIWLVGFCTRIHSLLLSPIIAPFCSHSSKGHKNMPLSLILSMSFPNKDNYPWIWRKARQCSKLFAFFLHCSQSHQCFNTHKKKTLDTVGRAMSADCRADCHRRELREVNSHLFQNIISLPRSSHLRGQQTFTWQPLGNNFSYATFLPVTFFLIIHQEWTAVMLDIELNFSKLFFFL